MPNKPEGLPRQSEAHWFRLVYSIAMSPGLFPSAHRHLACHCLVQRIRGDFDAYLFSQQIALLLDGKGL